MLRPAQQHRRSFYFSVPSRSYVVAVHACNSALLLHGGILAGERTGPTSPVGFAKKPSNACQSCIPTLFDVLSSNICSVFSGAVDKIR